MDVVIVLLPRTECEVTTYLGNRERVKVNNFEWISIETHRELLHCVPCLSLTLHGNECRKCCLFFLRVKIHHFHARERCKVCNFHSSDSSRERERVCVCAKEWNKSLSLRHVTIDSSTHNNNPYSNKLASLRLKSERNILHYLGIPFR